MENKNIKIKFLYTSLLSLILSGCGLEMEKSFKPENKSNDNEKREIVSVKSANSQDKTKFKAQLNDNKILKIERNDAKNDKKLSELMKEFSPIKISGEDVYLYKDNKSELNIIATEGNISESYIMETILKNDSATNKAQEENLDLLDRSSVTIALIEKNLKCDMRKYYQTLSSNNTEMFDYCSEKAFVQINYKIDMSGSKATVRERPDTKEIVKTEDGKYIIISVSPKEEGGTGWHLADEIEQGYHENWTNYFGNRNDYTAPFANKYLFWVNQKTENSDFYNPDISLIETFPQNTNPKKNVSETKGFNFGLSGGVKASISEVDAAKQTIKGDVGLELGANIQVTNSRTIAFETYEYTVENNSYNGKASWIWDAKVKDNYCEYLTRRDFNVACYFTGPIWDGNWTGNKSKFSAISHKSFTPAFQAIYKANKDFNGISTFELGTGVETGALLGGVDQFLLFKRFQMDAYTGMIAPKPKTFSIDWSSPFFASEQNIRLQDMSDINETKCLNVELVNKKSGVVTLEDCQETRNQIWGFDNETNQFKSRLGNNLCLAVNKSGSLEVNQCSFNNNQKLVLTPISKSDSIGYLRSYLETNRVISKASDSKDENKLILGESGSSNGTLKINAYEAKL